MCADVTGPSGGAHREWLVADGAGGFATGTASGLRTRRYHGLLVVPGPDGRRMGLASLDAAVTIGGGTPVQLSAHEWGSGVVSPSGFRHLELFEVVDGLPRWRWRIGDVVLERELAMSHGHTGVGVVHRLVSAPGPVRVTLTALCTWRDAHGNRTAGGADPVQTRVANGAVVDDGYRISGPGWRARGEWWHDAYLREEAFRGLDPVEDLWCAGTFTSTLEPGGVMEVSAWAGDLRHQPAPATDVVAAARRRARSVVSKAKPKDDVDATLALAADAFIIRGPDVVAGYPWFDCWMRDTLASYEGLFLRTGRAVEGAALLRRFAASPALVADLAQGASEAPLWLVHAVDRHVAATGDGHLGAELAAPLDNILAGYAADDAPFAARLDPSDGLLALRPSDGAATWMNVRTAAGVPVTPHDGKPVDVNALWVNALAGLAKLTERAGQDARALWAGHDAAQRSFTKRFVAPSGWLYDVVDAQPAAYPLGGGPHLDDPVLRPNQLFAYALPHAPLDGADPSAVRAVSRALLTPLGLRTLAPTEYGYQGRHAGAEPARGEAYHQGTAWPWLIGVYVDACRAVGVATDGLLRGLEAHLSEHGVGSVSEVVDGDAPYRASGCPFSARSVAELIRARASLRAKP
ncbi:amylo-alpha-1,6-glucosidase [Virgisporangium ochraceum]